MIRQKEWNVSVCTPLHPDKDSYSFTETNRKEDCIISELPPKSAFIDVGPICYSHSHLFRHEKTPKTCMEILQGDKLPTTYLHVTSFQDATCIGLTLPHIMYDILALCEILHEWCNLLSNKRSPRKAITFDPLQDITNRPYPKTKAELQEMEAKKLSTIQLFGWKEWIIWLSKFIFDAIIHPKEKSKLVFVPQRHIDAVRDRAAKRGHWISENDVVTASLFKVSLLFPLN